MSCPDAAGASLLPGRLLPPLTHGQPESLLKPSLRCCRVSGFRFPGASRPVEENPRSSRSSATRRPQGALRPSAPVPLTAEPQGLLAVSPRGCGLPFPSPEVCLSQAAVFPRSLPKYHFLGACPTPASVPPTLSPHVHPNLLFISFLPAFFFKVLIIST